MTSEVEERPRLVTAGMGVNGLKSQIFYIFKIFFLCINRLVTFHTKSTPCLKLSYLICLIRKSTYVCTFFFPQLVATFQFLLFPSVAVSVPLQLLSFSPVKTGIKV